MQATRIVTLDPAQPLHALTATARGMIEHTFVRAAQRAWTSIAPGRYAVFTHIGPYDTLYRSWDAIVAGALQAGGMAQRHAPPLELSLELPGQVAPEALRTEIWIPVA
jgi:predicted transcriptional regulator YdeE